MENAPTVQTLLDRSAKYLELKAHKDSLSAQLDDTKAELEALSAQMLSEMEALNLENYAYQDTTFYIKSSPNASVSSGKLDELITALDERDLGHLAKRTINQRTLTSFVREEIAENITMPDWLSGLVDVFTKTTVATRKK